MEQRALPQPAAGGTEWLVDAFNVLSVTLLGGSTRSEWWRAPARERLIERARALPPARGVVWLVFDGPGPAPATASGAGPHVVFAPSADDWILRRVKRGGGDGALVVVTSDRRLADRCRHAGARVIAPGEFVAACRADGGPAQD